MAVLAAVLTLVGKVKWQVVVLAAAAALAWRASDLAFERGRAACEAAIRTAASTERLRQARANQLALASGAEIVSALAEENARLKTLLTEIADDARDLPDGDACGLGADGLRLLDRLSGSPEPGGSTGGPHPGL